MNPCSVYSIKTVAPVFLRYRGERTLVAWHSSSSRPITCYTRAFGDGPRNFEPWSSDVDDTSAGTLSPNCHTTPQEDVSTLDRFNVHR
ncbi:hypothetical protein TNCV_4480311 [Trichonephila clavipes]|nr:hypothetical protein TNCV_4480311 [Trichonephila clavipes]